MFALAILIGIYAYFILALGFAGFLYTPVVVTLTFTYVVTILYFSKKLINRQLLEFIRISNKSHKIIIFYILILTAQTVVNLVGALGPELGFDALWYHLMLPKLYLENHSVFYIPGGLLYYSLMPKLTEMFYISALAINGEIFAKFIHFFFGILSCIALFRLSREFFSTKISLITVIIFYANLVVGWQSITAYVDLARTFFEVMALWGFVIFYKSGKNKWLIESAVMMGLAVSTKLLALGSLVIFSLLIAFYYFSYKKNPPNFLPALFIYWFVCLLIPLPWFIFSFIHTGNPIYPFFTELYGASFDISLVNPLKFTSDIWILFARSSDPISPIYIILLPFILFFFKKSKFEVKFVYLYAFLAIVIWYLTPRTGGGRFILPYLPAFSILGAVAIEKIKDKSLHAILITLIIIVSFISIFYRGIANFKYVPVIVGKQTKTDFLSSNLNFSFGDFYDTDGYFKNNVKSTDRVLLYGFHNLYYVGFPFVDSTWVKKGDSFNYIAVQNENLPEMFNDWEIIYQNKKTNVVLYTKGGIKWVY